MTDKQTNWTVAIIAIITSLTLLYIIQKVNDNLESSRLAVVELQKQIDKIHVEDEELRRQVAKLNNANQILNKDLDVTQELQRKQAQAILELKKGKRR
jgi:cell division protein FtsB